MTKKYIFRNSLVIGLIILLFGAGIVPCLSGNIGNNDDIESFGGDYDAYIPDCPADDGEYIPTGDSRADCPIWWASEDIWIDNNGDGKQDPPVVGAFNNLYVRIWNCGKNPTGPITVEFYYRDCSTGLGFPIGTTSIANTTCPNINPGWRNNDTHVSWFIPPNPSTGGHWCIGVLAYTVYDKPGSDTVYYENSIACCNLPVLYGRAGQPVPPAWFLAGNPFDVMMEFFFDIDADIPVGWEYVLDHSEPFWLNPGEIIEVSLSVYPHPNAQHGDTAYIDVKQNLMERGENIGGLSFKFIINDPPDKPIIAGPTQGKPGELLVYTAEAEDPDGDLIEYYYFEWDDGNFTLTDANDAEHVWDEAGAYSIKVKAIDSYNASSEWSDPLVVNMPRTILLPISFFMRLFERFPNAFQIIRHLLGL